MLTGGKRPPALPQGFFVEPTIFTDVLHDMTVWREEVSSCAGLCSVPALLCAYMGSWEFGSAPILKAAVAAEIVHICLGPGQTSESNRPESPCHASAGVRGDTQCHRVL